MLAQPANNMGPS